MSKKITLFKIHLISVCLEIAYTNFFKHILQIAQILLEKYAVQKYFLWMFISGRFRINLTKWTNINFEKKVLFFQFIQMLLKF